MSYDLWFCSDQPCSLSREDYEEFFAGESHFGEDWVYRNNQTGVYFSFTFEEADPEAGSPIPEGYFDSRLTFNINYSRPAFFALEAMPVVESLCRRFGLLVIDQQGHAIGQDGAPKEAKAADLIASWTAGNRAANQAFRGQGVEFRPYPQERIEGWWRHQYHKDALVERWQGEVFVPNVLFLLERKLRQVKTALVWTDGLPFVFPDCDVVIVNRTVRKGLFGKPKEEQGWIEAAEVRRRLAPYLTTVESGSGPVEALLPEQASKISGMVMELPIRPGLEAFERFPLDDLIAAEECV